MNSLRMTLVLGSLVLLAPTAGAADERVSAQVSAAILASVPKYQDVPGGGSSSDKPHALLTLPRMVIKGVQPPHLSERELNTDEGMNLLLLKRYPGATFQGQDPTGSNGLPNYAALMYKDDVRLARMAEFEHLPEAIAKEGNPEEAKKLKKEIQKLFLRGHDWRTEGMDRSINHWRN